MPEEQIPVVEARCEGVSRAGAAPREMGQPCSSILDECKVWLYECFVRWIALLLVAMTEAYRLCNSNNSN